MDDQFRQLLTNLVDCGPSQGPIGSSQASLMPLEVSQSRSTIDNIIPGMVTL